MTVCMSLYVIYRSYLIVAGIGSNLLGYSGAPEWFSLGQMCLTPVQRHVSLTSFY